MVLFARRRQHLLRTSSCISVVTSNGRFVAVQDQKVMHVCVMQLLHAPAGA